MSIRKITCLAGQRKSLGFALTVLLAILYSMMVARPVLAASSVTTPNFARIDAFITAGMQEKRIPGVQVAIIQNDHVVHLKGFGQANDEGMKVTPQTPFMIASSSKPITALAIMQLVEAGKVQLDAPVQRYLPWWRLSDPVQSSRVTIANLLDHTSGISGSLGGKDWLSDPSKRNWSLEDGVRSFHSSSFVHAVGTTFEYSNANYETLGLIVQTISGEEFGTYVKQHIFSPLHMNHSTLSLKEAQQEGLQQGYTWYFGFPRSTQNLYLPALGPAGMVISTAEDLSHLLVAQMNGGRYEGTSILSPQGIARMYAGNPHASFGPEGAALDLKGNYGLGWFNGSIAGVPAIYHLGTIVNYASLLVMEPQHHLGAVILMNVNEASLPTQEPIMYMQNNLTRLLAGSEPYTAPGLNVQSFYLYADSTLFVWAIYLLWSAGRLRRWSSMFGQRLQSALSRKRSLLLASLRVTWEVGLALLLLLGIPIVLGGISWLDLPGMFPDLGWALLLLSLLTLLIGIVRAVLLLRAARNNASASSSTVTLSLRRR
ncbi:class A beta-lactamase-related serine hydrolase [Ktedonosporobacter rubrisoli]|uniref:Class A beta-lactamase-related serine hydrolase n=1 Tax=Ktedonosporobacter rubrisoli TaxID=2509675 RepID=A0A4P6K0X1_KTERU|nr:serine hydrolase domain-containing protein [Ktedonosporobacter rubrisoli]QBD81625.1 class A beta-lactamase-related serine hydrolase [Ktedonosporobacter rubrisoli]